MARSVAKVVIRGREFAVTAGRVTIDGYTYAVNKGLIVVNDLSTISAEVKQATIDGIASLNGFSIPMGGGLAGWEIGGRVGCGVVCYSGVGRFRKKSDMLGTVNATRPRSGA